MSQPPILPFLPAAGGKTTRRPAIPLPRLLVRVLVGCLAALLLGASAGGLLGVRVLVISSGSMTPTLHVGDLVLSRSVRPLEMSPGDVVTFRDPQAKNASVTHRVVELHLNAETGRVEVRTKGDANSQSESWSVPTSGRVGLAIGELRWVGWWFLILHTRPARTGIVVLACGVALVTGLRRVWRG